MGKKVICLGIEESYIPNILESYIILNSSREIKYVDEFEVPYEFEVLTSTREGEAIPDVIEIKGLYGLYMVIDKEDCLPDVGLLDYEEKELGINLKDVTLRELYKEVLKKNFEYD